MSSFIGWLALFLLGNLVVALFVAGRGPTSADRLLAALLFGTTGTAILLLLSFQSGEPALVDSALVLALLAAITGAAFAQRAWRYETGGRESESE